MIPLLDSTLMNEFEIIEALKEFADDRQRAVLMRFFKTGHGQYGEGDQFLGLKVPVVRTIAKMSRDLPLENVPSLLVNEWHEVRLCGFLILTYKMEKLSTRKMYGNLEAIRQRDRIVRLYLEYADYANNWDLVDLSAPKIVGIWLMLPSEIENKDDIMDSLIESPVLWRQRIALVSTWKTTQQGRPEYALRYAERLVNHDHDLIHKAVGWMLREVGKRGGMNYLEEFLDRHAATMPRTALRYAIEQLPENQRRYYLDKMHIRKSVAEDIPRMLVLFEQSREVMRADGNLNQWTNGYPTRDVLLNDIANANSYVMCRGNMIVGTFAFIVGKDPTYSVIYEGEWKEDTRMYGTIHRLASCHGSHGVAEECFGYCWSVINNLRVDTHADNHIMQHCILKAGFEYCGIIHLANGDPRLAYQKLDF